MGNNIYVLATVFLPVIAGIIALLLARYNRVQRWLGFTAGVLAWGSSLVVLIHVILDGPQTYQLGGYQPPYGIVLVADMLSVLFVIMATTVMMAGLMYVIHSKDKCANFPAYVPLFLFMETGLNGAILTGDLFTFFVFLELMVLSSVSLVGISDNEYGLEAAIKYVFISGMGSLFLLLGVGSIYATFGTLNLADVGQQLATGARPLLASGAAVMLLAAFLLKSAVFPFHFWQPDFHTTAPTPVSAMLSSVIVKVGIYGIIRIVTLLFTEEAATIQPLLMGLGVIGIFFGSLSALRTHNGKRLLAYSTIGQIGFILIAIGWGTPLALMAAIVYAFNHAFIKSSLLMIMGLVSSRNAKHSANFEDIGGAGRLMPPIIGALWFLGGMSLAGIPPMNGFISKLTIVQSGAAGSQWLTVGLAVGSGALTVMYMFRTWQYVFQQGNHDADVEILPYGDGVIAPAFLISICILLGLYARPLILLAERAVVQIGDPSIYINAVNLAGG
jgi:multicomponent Na+:H+ antiporter subunit D